MKRIISEATKIYDKKEKEKAVLFLSFLLPFIMMVAILISKHVFPFGDKCILRTDFYHQYLPFYIELQNKMKNFESLFYTYKVGLGTNFITILAYYLSCPLNLLLVLVPDNLTLEFMTLMIVLKIALCGLSMSYYLVKRYNSDSFVIVFFSIFYAMGGYVSAYYWNIMWLNNIALFPLVVLGFENMYNGKKPYLYIITLALSLLTNYYIGVITCIFIFIYFIFYSVLKEQKIKKIGTNLLKTAIYSFNAILISAVLLLPVIFAFKTTASSHTSFPSSIKEYFTIVEVISRHLPFVTVENGVDYWPNLYSGIMCLPLLCLYFLSKKFKTHEKICYAVFLLFFIASFSINVLDFVWHIFKYPNSLPSRQSFIYTFLLLVLCMKPFTKLNSIKPNDLTLSFAISVLFLIVIEKLVINSKVGYYSIYAALIFLLIYLIIFLKFRSKNTNKNLLLYAAVILVCFEAFMNMYQTSITTIKRNDYMKNTKTIKTLTSNLKGITDDFYRVERAEMKTKDDGAFMHFPSSSIFSSSAYADGTEFYKKFGMEASTNAYSITGSTPFTDALLAVKYKIFEKEVNHTKELNLREISNADGVYLYQNIDTIPLSFVLTEDFLKDYDKSSGNPATVQNNFSRTLKLGTMLDKKTVEIKGKEAKMVIDESGDYYAFVRDKGIKEVVVTYPTTSKSFKNLNRGYFLELGYLETGVDLQFRNDTNDDELLIEVFRFDFETLRKVKDRLNFNAEFKMIKFDETSINYNINAKLDGTCAISLPYDEGFKVYLDGKEVEKEKVMDMLLGFKITKGEHEVLLKYTPQGLYLGLLLSFIGILMLAGIILYDKRYMNKLLNK